MIPAARASRVYAFPTSFVPAELVSLRSQMPLSRPQFMRGAATGIPHFTLRFDDLRVSSEL